MLPLCAAVVSHGGSGTVFGAAGLGLPQVCLPQAADQFRNTAGVVRVGRRDRAAPGPGRWSCGGRGRPQVLHDPRFRDAAGQLSQEIAAMPGPDEVVTRLEELVSPR